MTRKLLFATLAIVSGLLACLLVFGKGAGAGAQPPEAGASSRAPSSPDAIPYLMQEDFESGDFSVNAFYSDAPTCVPGGCAWAVNANNPHTGSYAAFAPEQNNISDQQLILGDPVAIPSD